MVINKLDSIEFRLKKLQDFTWLKKYGRAFWVVDETGSGCICIGMEDGEKRYFCKIAGVDTIEAEVSPKESVEILKEAVHLYKDLQHPNLIRIIEEYDYNQFYVVVFDWVDGECLFDHWNFEKYQNSSTMKSPKERFKELSVRKKLDTVNVLFSFLQNVNEKGYVAVDFYDGSIMYDFQTERTTICDIDFFRKAPVINDKGADWFGTKRLKAPEEYQQGGDIDEQTNIFTLGALIFEFFGSFSEEEIKQRYRNNQFVPCAYAAWQLNEESYRVATKAVNLEKSERYMTLADFYAEWKKANAEAGKGGREMYQIIEMKEMNMEEALYLCEQEYITQQQKSKEMPEFNQEMRNKMEGILCRLNKSAYGKAMLCDGELVGFLGVLGPWNGFHGLSKGVFSPLGASAFAGEKREKTASMLIAAVAEELVRDKIFSVSMSRYADDEEVNRAICLNSFGIRCSDAMLKLDNYVFSDKDSAIAIEELKGAEKLEIRDLYEELRLHLAKSPCFFPTPEGQVDRWFANEGIRIFAARYENKIAGYMAIDEEAETFITEREDVCNICGAYVSKEFRSTGIAKQLLDAVVEVCMREGRAYLGVDYETINPTALRFWTKYFEPYTYSFIRRIDERIEQYE